MAFRAEYGLALRLGGRVAPPDFVEHRGYEIPAGASSKVALVVDTHMRAAGRKPDDYGTPLGLRPGTEGASATFNGILVTVKRPEGADGFQDASGYELRGSGPQGEVALRLTRESATDPYTLSHAYTPVGHEFSGWSTGRPPKAVRRTAQEYFRIAL